MKKLLTGLLATLCLTACVPLMVVGSAAMGVWIGSDPREPEIIKSDFDGDAELEARILDSYKDTAHVNVNMFNDVVLLTGEVRDAAARAQIERFAQEMKRKPRAIHNEVVIGEISSGMSRLNDSQISARVKAAVLAEAEDPASVHIMVVTERSVVYLMGISRPEIIERAARSASRVSGVKQVVKLVELAPERPAGLAK